MNDYITFKLFFLINKIDFKRKITGERGGEGEIYRRSNMETYITICKISSQWELHTHTHTQKHKKDKLLCLSVNFFPFIKK